MGLLKSCAISRNSLNAGALKRGSTVLIGNKHEEYYVPMSRALEAQNTEDKVASSGWAFSFF